MLSNFLKNSLLLSAIIISVIGYNLWHIAWHGFFYQSNAIVFVLLFSLVKLGINGNRSFKVIANIGFWFSINNLLDELFFNPIKVGMNEYIFAIIIIITSLLIRRKNANK